MPAADVLQLVTDLADSLNDATACTGFYADVVYLMSLDPEGTLVAAKTINGTTTPTAVALPASTVTPLALIWDRRHLSKTSMQGAGLWDPHWFTTPGQPMVWVDANRPKNIVTLVPLPTQAPTAAVPLDPSVTAPGFNGLTIIYTETRANVHLDEELPLALEILAREMSRDSDHTDHTIAQACRTLSGILFRMLDLGLADEAPPPAKAVAESRQSGA